MTKLRTTLTIGVVVVAVIGAAAGFYLVNGASADAARSLLVVDAGLVVALAVTVYVLLGPTVKRLDDLVEALRALARGEKHARVEAADFAGLADVARAVNEVAASLCENDDPNLGPVQKRVRDKPQEVHKVKKPAAEVATADPAIGEVRVRRPTGTDTAKDAAPPAPPTEPSQKNTRPPLSPGEEVSEPRPRKKATPPAPAPAPAAAAESSSSSSSSTPPPPPAAPEPAPAATADAHEDRADDGDAAADGGGNDTVVEPAVPQLPSRTELQALFSEFVQEKRAAGHEDVDVDFEAFQETILLECERLLAEHGCKGVRFEVAVGGGDVSLRPRLLR